MAANPNEKALRNISDTARWVAFYRAMETERPDAIFHDPYARRLAGERGAEIVRTLPGGKRGAWSMIVRTAVLDEIILKVLARDAVDAVINLAAGLDARPYRLPLPEALQWVEIDLPEMIAYKAESLQNESPRCRLEHVAVDLTDARARREIFSRINASASRVLILTEGLLGYLTPEQVGDLAGDLHAQPHFAFWLTDIASPMVLKRIKKQWGKKLSEANAVMHFAPESSSAFFKPFGWEDLEFRDFLHESQRLNRNMPGAWFLRAFARAAPRRFERQMAKWKSGVVLLGRI